MSGDLEIALLRIGNKQRFLPEAAAPDPPWSTPGRVISIWGGTDPHLVAAFGRFFQLLPRLTWRK